MSAPHELTFEGRDASAKERLDFAEGTLIGALKLLARARRGEDTRGNCRCIAQWLRAVAQQMDELAEKRE